MNENTEIFVAAKTIVDELSRLQNRTPPPRESVANVKWGQSAIEKRLTDAAAKAMADYRKSESGSALLASLRSGRRFETMADLKPVFSEMLAAPSWQPVHDLLAEHRVASANDRSFEIRSLSIGIEVMIFIAAVGFQGNVGVAVPPHDMLNFQQYVIYLSGGFELGVGETEFGGLVVGFWTTEPLDMAGPSKGIAIDLGAVAEIVVEASFSTSNSDFLGISIAEGEGEGGSIEFVESDTWVFGWDAPHVYQPRDSTSNYMIIQNIVCDRAGESSGDEIYFKFTPDDGLTYRYPTQGRFALNDGQSWQAGRSIFFKESVKVEIFDNDDAGDDSRGSVTYSVGDFPYNKQVSDNGGQYSISAVLNPTFPEWSSGQKINSADSTALGPGMCTYRGQLYYFWRSNNGSDRIYFSSSADGAIWPNGRTINDVDVTPDSPCAIEFGGELFVFWRGGNTGVYWSSSADGLAPWPNGQRIGNSATKTPAAPCVFNDTLYVFWCDASGGAITYSRYNATSRSWGAPTSLNYRDGSNDRVAPCVYQNQLYVFWRNSGDGDDKNQIFYSAGTLNASGTVSFPWGQTINHDETTAAAPCANVDEGNLFVFYVSNDSSKTLIWTASASGKSWPTNSRVTSNASGLQGAPAVATFNGGQYLGWTSGSKLWFSAPKN